MAISKKQQAFIDAYLQCWNATQAAIEAGYSARTARQQGSRLLSHVDIDAEIQRRIAENAMTANEALARLAAIARGDMGQFVEINGRGQPSLQFENADLRLIKKIKRVEKDGDTTIEFELYDAQAALALLLKRLDIADGTATELVQITGAIDAAATAFDNIFDQKPTASAANPLVGQLDDDPEGGA
jgi:phage terminase small subunit